MKLAGTLFKGCIAGSGMCYIKAGGEVLPCPFVPLSGGNARDIPLREIWYESKLFQNLRKRENLTGERCRIILSCRSSNCFALVLMLGTNPHRLVIR